MNQRFKGQEEHAGGSRNASLPTSGRSGFKEGVRGGMKSVGGVMAQRYGIDEIELGF
jgi:hypothetical protein